MDKCMLRLLTLYCSRFAKRSLPTSCTAMPYNTKAVVCLRQRQSDQRAPAVSGKCALLTKILDSQAGWTHKNSVGLYEMQLTPYPGCSTGQWPRADVCGPRSQQGGASGAAGCGSRRQWPLACLHPALPCPATLNHPACNPGEHFGIAALQPVTMTGKQPSGPPGHSYIESIWWSNAFIVPNNKQA